MPRARSVRSLDALDPRGWTGREQYKAHLPSRSAALVKAKKKEHRTLVNAGLALVGAASVSKVDQLIVARPFGERVPPSAIALGVSVAGALLASRMHRAELAQGLAAVSVGLGAGILTRAITQRVQGAHEARET